jgi:hypothetical protein
MPSQLCNGFYQGQVRLFSNDRQHTGRQLFQGRNAASPWLRGGAPAFMPALHPLNRRTHTDSKMLGGLTARCARFNGLNNAFTQVTGARLRHRYPPAMESMLKDSRIRSILGIPQIQIGREPLLIYSKDRLMARV